MRRKGAKVVSANAFPSTVVSALGTTMTSARALVVAYDPRRTMERIQAKPTPRFWDMTYPFLGAKGVRAGHLLRELGHREHYQGSAATRKTTSRAAPDA